MRAANDVSYGYGYGYGLGLGLGLVMATPALASPPTQITTEPAAIVGGEASQTCAWPSVVALKGGGLCTATLIHPRVVAYAAHCGTLQSKVVFGEDADAPAREVDTLQCERFTNLFAVSSMDYAYCLLAEPVDDVPITPPLFGCDEDRIEIGTPVTIVGFGDTTSSGPEQVGIKHEAQTEITGELSTVWIGGMGVGADAGDSGGPAFVELDGAWWLLGIVSGGGGDGASVQYVPAPNIVEWIETRSNVDVTPCHDADGSWAPTPSCEGFYVATDPGAQWSESCPGEVSGPADRCGPAWTEIVDDAPPSVAFVDPVDGDAFPGSLVIFDVLAEASDDVGVAEVRLVVDGQPWIDALGQIGADEVAPYRFEAVELDAGAHLLELEAVDHVGHGAVASAMIQIGEDAGTEGGDTGDSTDTGAESGGDTTTGGATETGGPCTCTSDGRRPTPLAALGLLVILLARRQR